MELTAENYYSPDANREYMSVSQFKDFFGTYGTVGCEFCALEKLEGRWFEEPSTAMKVGSYVDAYFEGTLDDYKQKNPDMFKRDGELKADYIRADNIIARAERDPYFMQFMSGDKQVIMTGEIGGVPWKIKIDSYLPDTAIVDLKVMSTLTKANWVKDVGYLDFIRYWGYDYQAAVYQEIVRQCTGKKLPFYIAALSKEQEPDLQIIHVTDNFLEDALRIVEGNLPRVLDVKNHILPPDRCEICDCCRSSKVLKKPISILDLMQAV